MSASSKNFYEVLNISRTASHDEIRREYKKLALHWHPDRNSAAEATVRFQEISEAYSVLSDAKKREMYDMTGEADIDEESMDVDEFLRDIFGGDFGAAMRSMRGMGGMPGMGGAPFMFFEMGGESDSEEFDEGPGGQMPLDMLQMMMMMGGMPGMGMPGAGPSGGRPKHGGGASGARRRRNKAAKAKSGGSSAAAAAPAPAAAAPAAEPAAKGKGKGKGKKAAAAPAPVEDDGDDEDWVEMPGEELLHVFMMEHMAKAGRQYVCTVCERVVDSMDALRGHFEQAHVADAEEWALTLPAEELEGMAAAGKDEGMDLQMLMAMLGGMGMGPQPPSGRKHGGSRRR